MAGPGIAQAQPRTIADRIKNLIFVKRDAPFYARYTLHHHLVAGILEGLCAGILAQNTYVAKRSLFASDNVVTALAAWPSVVFLLSALWSHYMNDRNNRYFILVSGALGRLALVAFFFIDTALPLLGMIILYNLMHSVFMPAQSRIFQANYSNEIRGSMYSRVQTRTMLTTAIIAFITGWLLDLNFYSYRWLFPLAGIFGFWAYYRYTLIGIRGGGAPQEAAKKAFPFSYIFTILRKDRNFLWYEIFFFIYGLGFMVTFPLIFFFFDEVLNMNYRDFSSTYMVVPQLIMLVLLPFFGRMLDRLNPVRTCAIAFAFLAFWPLILGLTTRIWQAYAAFAFYGIGMAAVNVTWTLGALYFAPAREAQKYHSIHVTFVGLRAAFAPWLAIKIFRPWLGIRSTFFMGAVLFAVGAVCMFLLHLRSHPRPFAQNADNINQIKHNPS